MIASDAVQLIFNSIQKVWREQWINSQCKPHTINETVLRLAILAEVGCMYVYFLVE